MQKAKKYVKLDPIEHILIRPDMYLGSTKERPIEEFVCDEEFNIFKKTILTSPGMIRIFIELISNIIDNVARSKNTTPVTQIDISISKETGETILKNDGEIIPIQYHDTEKMHNHTLIFGHLLSSSNFDDEEERVDISGRNGLGSKICNVFSSVFTVKSGDGKKLFTQTWKNNMKEASDPIIEKKKCETFTEISYVPDFKQFGINGYTDDILSHYKKYIIDCAMITKVPTYFNGKLVPCSNLVDYSKLYIDNVFVPIENDGEENDAKSIASSKSGKEEILHIKTDNCEVVLLPSVEGLTVSFANGCCTPLGGTHVDSWSETLFRPILEKLNKKDKPQITMKDVKGSFKLFITASVINPRFESQSKLKLEEPAVVSSVLKKDINKLLKWQVISLLQDFLNQKEMGLLEKLQRKKRGVVKVDKFEPANNEGGKLGRECTLIIVEGDSAKPYAVSGIEEGCFGRKGRDWFGIYPARGKLLNCINSTPAVVSKNKVISDIFKILGVSVNTDYTDEKNFTTLRYGKVLILTDQDVDGFHICGLIQACFHAIFPTLLERKDPFLNVMATPLIKVNFSKKKDMLFYNQLEYNNWLEEYRKEYPNKKLEIEYYKGLGTSVKEMVKRTFGKKIACLVKDEKASDTMMKVFHKKYTNYRKTWLANYEPGDIKLKWSGEESEVQNLKISDFLNTELIKFSIADCQRSIPHIMDGFKTSQRKVMYVAFERNLKFGGPAMKVGQLGPAVAEKTSYHHGENNLLETIINLAQDYVGSNNIPLLFPQGQFGSRIELGQDSANARYIFTKLNSLTRLLFPECDDGLLNLLEDDGNIIEPEYFVPILPTVLINGTQGIGTGWSSTIPCFNPIDLIKCVKIWLDNNGKVITPEFESLLPPLSPWYRAFTGEIKRDGNRFICSGFIETVGKNKKVVKELPIGLSTTKFREKLNELLEEKKIKDITDHSSVEEINFKITELNDGLSCTIDNLNLVKYFSLNNMVLFTKEGLRKFKSVDEIIDYFCGIRYDFYVKRKISLVKKYESEMIVLANKKRFIEDYISGELKLFNNVNGTNISKSSDELESELNEKKFDKINDSFDYLLSIQVRGFTQEKVEKLFEEYNNIKELLETTKNTSEKDMWISELDEFETAYKKWIGK